VSFSLIKLLLTLQLYFITTRDDPDMQSSIQPEDTPLHRAALLGTINSVQELLSSKADPSIYNNMGDTPLHYAVTRLHADKVSILLRYMTKLQLSLVTNGGDTVVHHAAGLASPPPSCDIYTAVSLRLSLVRILVEAGVDISVKNKLGQTAEDIAVLRGRLGVARLLQTESVRRATIDAFMMGLHSRLGAQSIVSEIDPGIVQLITGYI
jgi:Ankyrin repeats (3 copies)/Ankyrin repeats (many copies)